MRRRKVLCLDFDGVLHSYASGWRGITNIPDPPVDGALDFLRRAVNDERFDVRIYSARSSQEAGIFAMTRWLLHHGLEPDVVARIGFDKEKPPAWLTIDDRAWCFRGQFPSLEAVAAFTAWNGR